MELEEIEKRKRIFLQFQKFPPTESHFLEGGNILSLEFLSDDLFSHLQTDFILDISLLSFIFSLSLSSSFSIQILFGISHDSNKFHSQSAIASEGKRISVGSIEFIEWLRIEAKKPIKKPFSSIR